jgi:hypothetical protein
LAPLDLGGNDGQGRRFEQEWKAGAFFGGDKRVTNVFFRHPDDPLDERFGNQRHIAGQEQNAIHPAPG